MVCFKENNAEKSWCKHYKEICRQEHGTQKMELASHDQILSQCITVMRQIWEVIGIVPRGECQESAFRLSYAALGLSCAVMKL